MPYIKQLLLIILLASSPYLLSSRLVLAQTSPQTAAGAAGASGVAGGIVGINAASGAQAVCEGTGINTALGCISSNPDQFVTQIVQLAVGIGGALGLILILYGFFIVTTSAGIPDKIKAGQEVITSAIIGLVFITLSVVMMRFLGITVFSLPGLR